MDEAADPSQLNEFALADSFINFDYVPEIPASDDGYDPAAVGSGSSLPVHAGNCTVAEGIEKISLTDNEANGNSEVRAEIIANDDEERESPESGNAATTPSSTTSSSESEDKQELEEGEIVDSDPVDYSNDDSEDVTNRGVVVDNDDDDDDDDDRTAERPVRSQNELETLPMVPPVNVTLGPHHQMLPVGIVTSIIGTKVIVEGSENHVPLNEGSILWMTRRREPLGLIDEIFGPVENPYYVVRYNSESEVPEGLLGGTLISFVPEFANHVLNNKDLYKKGYDASGVNDEEVSDEAEFSDDEKEAEYMRMQKMTKRCKNNQNPENRGETSKEVPPKDGPVSTLPVAPATPLPALGHCSPISGIAQGLVGATNVNPSFPPANAGPNLTTSGVWRNGTALPHAPAMPLPPNGHCSPISGFGQGFVGATNANPPFPPANAGPNFTANGVRRNGAPLPPQQSAVLPNGFPTNGAPWYPGNTQIPHQLPVPGVQFQQQFNPNQGFPPATVYPGAQPNIFAQPMYAQGPVNQNHNQIPYGLNAPFPQYQPPGNLHSGSISGNHHAPYQFNPGASAGRGRWTGRGRGRGRRAFHHGGRNGWRPAM